MKLVNVHFCVEHGHQKTIEFVHGDFVQKVCLAHVCVEANFGAHVASVLPRADRYVPQDKVLPKDSVETLPHPVEDVEKCCYQQVKEDVHIS